MGCGCGGASNVYKQPAGGAKAKEAPAAAASGFPAVWNGPKPKTSAK